MDTEESSIASIPDVSLILNETVSLVASMRKQARWSTSSVAAILGGAVEASYSDNNDLATRWGLRGNRAVVSENPLLAGFSRLRQELLKVDDISQFDTPALLRPFLAVIRSSSTTGTITSLALNSISKFFSYRLIHKRSPKLAEAMKDLSSAVTHCRFEATDSGQDEVVLLRILLLMQEMMSGIGGDVLSDESVCEMMETGLSMCCQMRLSEMLRRSAEMTMLKMVQVVFLRLRQQDPKDDEAQFNGTPPDSPKMTPLNSPQKVMARDKETNGKVSEERNPTANNDNDPIVPYGIMSVRELMRVLISILNPNERQHTDSMRIMALRIIEVALEVGGLAIAQRPSLRKLATDDLCRFLFQLVRSDNHIVLQNSLRVISTLLHTMRVYLKLQQELFLNYVVACLVPKAETLRESGIDPTVYEALPLAPKIKALTSGRSTPVPVRDQRRLGLEGGARGADAREVMIECIGSLVRIPTFMIDLFVNYDCEENLSDLCEDVIGFLCRNAFPDAAIWSTTNVPPLCLDALLGFINLVHARLHSDANQINPDLPNPARLNDARARKELVVKAAAKFNEDTKLGIQFMRQHQLIDTTNEDVSLAMFLFSSGRINKKLLGDFISKPKNLPLLQAFVKLFDFSQRRLDEALRDLLQKFRLPGEAQQIARIVEEFAAIYHKGAADEVHSADAAYVLSYAVIMLNTDQHNPQAKKSKMTSQDFSKNLRGTNDGEDFPAEYLAQIYDDIRTNEIIMPEEHDTSASFEYAWKELQAKISQAGPLIICETNLYDEAMFRATWRPLIATLSYVFQSATDDAVFSRVIGGISQCATIASKYGISDVLDQIIASLSRMTLLEERHSNMDKGIPISMDKQNIIVTDLSISFGREFKAQLAMVILARICHGNEALIQGGWSQLFAIFTTLFDNSILPPTFTTLTQHMSIQPLPTYAETRPVRLPAKNQDSGFFGSVASYLSSYASDDPPPPSAEEIEATMCTFDCIGTCRLTELITRMTELPSDQLEYIFRFLLSEEAIHIPTGMETPEMPNGFDEDDTGRYDTALLLKLEAATALCIKNETNIATYACKVLARIEHVLTKQEGLQSIMRDRLSCYALRLHQALLEAEIEHSSTIFKIVADSTSEVLLKSPVSIAYGVLGCLQIGRRAISSQAMTHALTILGKIWTDQDAASLVFESLSLLSASVDLEQAEGMITLLSRFAQAGEVGYQDELQSIATKRQNQAQKRNNSKLTVPAKPSASHQSEVQRACRAIELLYQLPTRIPKIISDKPEEQNWRLILIALRDQCLNVCKEVRSCASTYLQRLLLSIDLSSESPTHQLIFDDVLLYLLKRLISADNPLGRSRSLEDTQVQCSSLTCKVWLHHFVSFKDSDDAVDQWLRVLRALLELIETNQSPHLAEAVTESIKNVLLVMSSSDVLKPDTKIYTETSKLLTDAKLDSMTDLFKKLSTNDLNDSVQQEPDSVAIA